MRTTVALHPPVLDEASEAVLEEAVASLGTARGLEWVGDDGVLVHVLASLITQAQTRLREAVAGALDQGYTLAELGHVLETTENEVRNQFIPAN